MARGLPRLVYSTLLGAALAVALGGPASAEAPAGRRGRVAGSAGPPEGRRRALEPSPGVSEARRASEAFPFEILVRSRAGCQLEAAPRLTAALTALGPSSPLMSLEVWGDSHEYAPFDKVLFYFRAPRPTYVTLYWLGPAGHVVVPVRNVRVPANRDAMVDAGGYIVPPLGREQWVAVGTLEPLNLGCGDEDAMLAAVARMDRLPHAVGRWEVRSKEEAPRYELPPAPRRLER